MSRGCLAALAGLVVAVAGGCSGPTAAVPESRIAQVWKGRALPLQAERLPDGAPVRLEDLRGKVVLVDFWASWCEPCRTSMPFYADLQKRYRARGFEVVGVGVDDERAAAERFAEQLRVPFTLCWDRGQRTASAVELEQMPTAFLIDRRGLVRHVVGGFDAGSEREIAASLEVLLTELPDAATATGASG